MVQYLEMDGYVQCVMMGGYVQCAIEQYKQMLIVISIGGATCALMHSAGTATCSAS
jgi:hypothetical protein